MCWRRFRPLHDHSIQSNQPLAQATHSQMCLMTANTGEAVAAEHYNRANATIATEFFHAEMLAATEAANERTRLGKIKPNINQ